MKTILFLIALFPSFVYAQCAGTLTQCNLQIIGANGINVVNSINTNNLTVSGGFTMGMSSTLNLGPHSGLFVMFPDTVNRIFTRHKIDSILSVRTFSINGVAYNLSASRTWNVGTVTSIGLSSTDFTVSGSPVTTAGSITIDLQNSGVTAGTYEYVTVNAKGIVTAGYNSATSLIASRIFGTAYQASNTSRIYDVDFTVTIAVGGGILMTSDGLVVLETSANGSSGWTEFTRSRNANGGVASAQNTQTAQIIAYNIPAGYYYRLVFTNPTGTGAVTYVEGHETLRR